MNEKLFTELLALFQKYKLTADQIILTYSNLGYSLGASIDGVKDKISLEELELKYATAPTMGVSLMLQCLLMSTWVEERKKNDKT